MAESIAYGHFTAASDFARVTVPRLTKEQRAALFAGKKPRIAFPGNRPCPVEDGDVYPLSTQLSIRFTDTHRRSKLGEWVPDFVIEEGRPNLLRRVPPADPVPAQGDLDAEAIENAAQESAYTHSSREAVPGDPGEAPPRQFVNRETTSARNRDAERWRTERAEQRAHEDARGVGAHLRELVVRMARAGVDPAPMLLEFERRIREEQRKLDR